MNNTELSKIMKKIEKDYLKELVAQDEQKV